MKGDEVLISAKVIGVSESGNPIIKLKSGVRMLIKKSDITSGYMNWVHDKTKWEYRFFCDKCGFKIFDEPYNYCPSCGRKRANNDGKADA